MRRECVISSFSSAAPVEPAFDMAIVSSLTDMGFPLAACKRAAIITNGQGVEAATQWIMEHMDDPDFNVEPVVPTITTGCPTACSLPTRIGNIILN